MFASSRLASSRLALSRLGAPAGFLRRGLPPLSRWERFAGRVTLGGIVVFAAVLVLEALIPGDDTDAIWLGAAAAVIVVAHRVGFWPSVVIAFGAAATIQLLVDGNSAADAVANVAALLLFLAVALLGAAAVADRAGRPSVAPAASRGDALPEPLTEREAEILGLLAAGLSNRDIAATLVVSENTVKSHLEHLYGKLGVGSRLQAIARARSLGLLDESSSGRSR